VCLDRKKCCAQGIEGDFGELWQVVRMPQMIMLLLYFFSSNFFYTSRFNGIQGTFFNSRTRGLNTMLYWVCTCDMICKVWSLPRFYAYGRSGLAQCVCTLCAALRIHVL
jgi:hypothetical protein